MRRITWTLVAVLALAAFLIAPLWAADSEADNSENDCKLKGTWILDLGWGKWMMTFNGTGDNKGTGDWEFILPDTPGFSWTSGRGVWVKTSPKTYDYTFQTYYVDDAGNIYVIGLNEGTMTQMGCNTAELVGEGKYFEPGDDEPYATFSPDPLVMQRLLLHQPSPIQ
jgi:hypothetical protein